MPWVPGNDFSARLAALRNRLRWNAKEAALACGISQQSWRNWEEGSKPQDYEEVCKRIAERTGCDLDWLALGRSVQDVSFRGLTSGRDDDGGPVNRRFLGDNTSIPHPMAA